VNALPRAPFAASLLAAALALPAESDGPFRDVAAGVGLHFTHDNGATGAYHLPEIMGAGGALFDYDGDGDLDVLLLQGGTLDGPSGAARRQPHHRLFRNDLSAAPGSLSFTDVTDRAGVAPAGFGMGAAVGDYDGDGRPDVYITSFGPNRLYRNTGGGTFRDVTSEAGAGLDDPRWSTSASFTDYDADGDLDLFIANYVDFTVAGAKVCHDPLGVRDYCGPLQFRPVPDRLFRNDGDGTFTDVTEAAGISAAGGPGLGVVGQDLDGDGRIDFFVANDAMANQLWINRGDGTFEDRGLLAGVALTMDGLPEGSMGIAVGDPDGDGDVDLFITNITGETHAFYQARGKGVFDDARLAAGLGAPTAPSTGFGAGWLDYDNDGWLDLFVANGAVTMLEALAGDSSPFDQRNQLFRNLGGGRFREITGQAGSGLRLVEVSRGAAFGDIDNDGDMDVLVTNNGGPVRLLLNDGPSSARWLQIQLEGVQDNRAGLGARVGVRRPDGTTLWRRAHTDGSYLVASDPRVHVGLGTEPAIAAILVEWPGGGRERWEVGGVDRLVRLRQGTGRPWPQED